VSVLICLATHLPLIPKISGSLISTPRISDRVLKGDMSPWKKQNTFYTVSLWRVSSEDLVT
jgi:hypothetical protein